MGRAILVHDASMFMLLYLCFSSLTPAQSPLPSRRQRQRKQSAVATGAGRWRRGWPGRCRSSGRCCRCTRRRSRRAQVAAALLAAGTAPVDARDSDQRTACTWPPSAAPPPSPLCCSPQRADPE
ncbi:Protein of unknown function, partial [Gryllus bimaculatus]